MQHFAHFGSLDADFGIIKQQNKQLKRQNLLKGYQRPKISNILAEREAVMGDPFMQQDFSPINNPNKVTKIYRGRKGNMVKPYNARPQNAPLEPRSEAAYDEWYRGAVNKNKQSLASQSPYEYVKSKLNDAEGAFIRGKRQSKSYVEDPLQTYRVGYNANSPQTQKIIAKRLENPRIINKNKDGTINNRGVNRYDMRGGSLQ
jgi:hypothetical protein